MFFEPPGGSLDGGDNFPWDHYEADIATIGKLIGTVNSEKNQKRDSRTARSGG